MKAVVARAQAGRGLDPQRRVGGQMAGLGVELRLPNRIGPVLSRRGSSTLSLKRAMWGTKANWFDGSV